MSIAIATMTSLSSRDELNASSPASGDASRPRDGRRLQIVEIALQRSQGLGEMMAHRRGGTFGIAAQHGVEDRGMLGGRGVGASRHDPQQIAREARPQFIDQR